MKTFLITPDNILMTLATCLFSIRICRVFYHPLVGSFPVGIIGITPMAGMTIYITVVFILKDIAINEYLFMWGQRLHLSSSSLTLIFRFNNRSCLRNLPGYRYQKLRTGMTLKALAFLCLSDKWIALNKEQKGDNQKTNHCNYPISSHH